MSEAILGLEGALAHYHRALVQISGAVIGVDSELANTVGAIAITALQHPYDVVSARYRAALEEIVLIRPASTNYDDAYWAGVNSGVAECQDIANRALHPEEEAGDHGELVK